MLACAVTAVVLLPGCDANRSSLGADQIKTQRPLVVNTIRIVEVKDAIKTEVAFGKLKPNRPARLAFDRPGEVKTVLKQVGDSCDEGEPLAVLAQPQLQQQKETLSAALDQLKQNPQAAEQVAETTAQLRGIEAQLDAGIIRAPFKSVVIECNVKQSSATSPAVTAFIVAENAIPFVEVNLSNDVASELKSDQKVWAAIDGRTVVAKLITPLTVKDSAVTQKLQLEFVDELKEESWAFGDVVELRFYVRTGQAGVWVPISALQKGSAGQWTVSAVADIDGQGTVERKSVEVVQLEDEFALVSGDFLDGDEIVAEGGHRIVAGQKVTTVDVSRKFRFPSRQRGTE